MRLPLLLVQHAQHSPACRAAHWVASKP